MRHVLLAICDGRTDGPNDRPTDKEAYRVASTRLKIPTSEASGNKPIVFIIHIFIIYTYINAIEAKPKEGKTQARKRKKKRKRKKIN